MLGQEAGQLCAGLIGANGPGQWTAFRNARSQVRETIQHVAERPGGVLAECCRARTGRFRSCTAGRSWAALARRYLDRIGVRSARGRLRAVVIRYIAARVRARWWRYRGGHRSLRVRRSSCGWNGGLAPVLVGTTVLGRNVLALETTSKAALAGILAVALQVRKSWGFGAGKRSHGARTLPFRIRQCSQALATRPRGWSRWNTPVVKSIVEPVRED